MRKLIVSSILLILSFQALSQDYSLDAAYGNVELDAGFLPDPYVVNLNAGGELSASSLANGCVGYIANPPDVQLTFQAGSSPLYISVLSESDTTLVVNLPSGG